MPNPSFADKIRSWDLLNTNLKPHLPDMPEAKDFQVQFEALIASAKTLDSQQSDLRGKVQEATRLRLEAVQQAEDLKGRLAALLRARFGFKAETLLSFGLPPRRARRRKAKTTPADPANPVTPTSPTTQPEAAGATPTNTPPTTKPATP